ncbi:MAG: ParA family protein [Acidobacteria bacterium]|nr:ParA family protein [Acidobacteriota bacterium]
MKRVIFNQKGGVGKSSIAVNLAAIRAAQGRRVLVVDLDPQANASHYLLGDLQADHHLGEFFEQFLGFNLLPWPAKRFVVSTHFPHLNLMASHPVLADQHHRLEVKHKIYKLRDALKELDEYEDVFIDTPPAFNFFTLSALIAADTCLVPFDCDRFSRQALYNLIQAIQEINADHNPKLRLEGVAVNQYRARANLPKQMIRELKEEGVPIFKTCLSSSVVMQESHERCQPLIHCAPNHKLTSLFQQLADELSD